MTVAWAAPAVSTMRTGAAAEAGSGREVPSLGDPADTKWKGIGDSERRVQEARALSSQGRQMGDETKQTKLAFFCFVCFVGFAPREEEWG